MAEPTKTEQQIEPILQFFGYAHLPPALQLISKPFCDLAHAIVEGDNGQNTGTVTSGPPLPRNPERTVALRKLLEAKDAAVRALLFKGALLLVLGAALFCPALALAADAALAAPSLLGGLLSSLLTPGGIAIVLGVLATILGALAGNSVLWKQRVGKAVFHAFHIVEDIDSDPGALGRLSKLEAGLKAANDYMLANGWRPLKPGEQAVAALTFQSMNGQAEAASVVQAKAQVLAAELAAPKAPPSGP